MIDGWVISGEITPRWMLLDFTDDKSILVQVMAWCRQATSHYLSQWSPGSMSPYIITGPQWVNSFQISSHLPGIWPRAGMFIFFFSAVTGRHLWALIIYILVGGGLCGLGGEVAKGEARPSVLFVRRLGLTGVGVVVGYAKDTKLQAQERTYS